MRYLLNSTLVIAGLLVSCFAVSQQAEPHVIAVAGGSNNLQTGFTVDFTIGEPIIITVGSNPVCTQGFLQPLSAKDYPVVQLNLRGTLRSNYIQLDWTSTTEINNKLYYIERSADGVSFNDIDSVPTLAPGGNSNSPINYQRPDLQPHNGANYYRLRQVSMNGSISYSETILLNFSGDNWRLHVYPNPTPHTLYAKLYVSAATRLSFQITSVVGQVSLRKSLDVPVGYSTHVFDLNTISAGLYILSVRDHQSNQTQTVKFIKL